MDLKYYGKRIIPRKREEFQDLIYPHYRSGDYSLALSLLMRYYKKKRLSRMAMTEIKAGVIACCFNGDLRIELDILLKYFNVAVEDFVYDLNGEFYPYFHENFIKKHKSVCLFLKNKFNSFVWTPPWFIDEDSKNIKQFMNELPSKLVYDRDWKLGLKEKNNKLLIHMLITYELEAIVESAIKQFREKKGNEFYGIQWKEEYLLGEKIIEAFPKLIVIKEGSPEWLKSQRFDLWLPELNAAIEYNGKQHYEPVDFFGGREGYELTLERDLLKKQKANINDCNLLIVKKGYKIEEVIDWINKQKRFKNIS